MVARLLKLRFRDLPENRAAITTALMISDTAKLMMSRFFHEVYYHFTYPSRRVRRLTRDFA